MQPKIAIIGSGLAGLTASIEAIRNGAKVILIEKMPNCFGNSAKATSGINGINTKYQQALSIVDGIDVFENDTLKYGGKSDLVQMLARNSKESIEWLSSFGIDLSVLSQCGGHSVKRTHREPDYNGRPSPIGWDLVSMLKKELEKQDDFELRTNTLLKDVILNENRVTDIVIEQESLETIKVDAVILATGGYSNDHTIDSLLKEYAVEASTLPTTNGHWATGDGVKIGKRLGLDLVDMDKVQIHPTGFVDPSNPTSLQKFLGPEALRAHGGILVDKNGKRFCNELGPRDYVSKQIFEHGHELGGFKTAYLILNDKMANEFSLPTLSFYQKKNLVFVFDSVERVAEFIGCDTKELGSTLEHAGDVGLFGKSVIPNKFNQNDAYYVSLITPSIHYTMGGLGINAAAEVLRKGEPIVGLFGAGEVTGGVHGSNRLAGNSLLECVVFGRIAGSRAARILEDNLKEFQTTVRSVSKEEKGYIVRLNLNPGKQSLFPKGTQVYLKHAKKHYSCISEPTAVGYLDIWSQEFMDPGMVVDVQILTDCPLTMNQYIK